MGKVASRSVLSHGGIVFRMELYRQETNATHVSDESMSSLFASADGNPLTAAPFGCLL